MSQRSIYETESGKPKDYSEAGSKRCVVCGHHLSYEDGFHTNRHTGCGGPEFMVGLSTFRRETEEEKFYRIFGIGEWCWWPD